MTDTKQTIKPCPNGCPVDVDRHHDDVLFRCPECGVCARPSSWNALPRREEFHAELMDLVEYPKTWGHMDKEEEYGRLYFRLTNLAYKYAPVREGEKDDDD